MKKQPATDPHLLDQLEPGEEPGLYTDLEDLELQAASNYTQEEDPKEETA